MAMTIRVGRCKYCHQNRNVAVSEDSTLTQDEIDELASEECDCDAAELARKRDADVKRCQNYIAGTIARRFPYMTQLLEWDVEAVANEESDRIVRSKDGYRFTTGPTKDRIVDIKVRWCLESEPGAPTPLGNAQESQERQQDEPVPEEI